VVFSDPSVGEFQHEISATVDLPEEAIEIPKTPISPPIYVDESRAWNLNLQFKNENSRNARKNVESWIAERKRKDPKYTFTLPNPDFMSFDIEVMQPQANALILPKSITLYNPIKTSKRKENEKITIDKNIPTPKVSF
jgi:hypothetical protein